MDGRHQFIVRTTVAWVGARPFDIDIFDRLFVFIHLLTNQILDERWDNFGSKSLPNQNPKKIGMNIKNNKPKTPEKLAKKKKPQSDCLLTKNAEEQ